MDVPHALNDIGIRQGLKGYKRKSSTISHKAGVGGLSVFLLVAILCVQSCFNKDNESMGVPIEEMIDIANHFEEICETYTEWKLESSDHKLTIYTSQDSIPGYASMCLVLYHDGNQVKAVTEENWRTFQGLKSDEPCPLFSNGHRHLYTINNKLEPNNPLYIIVTEDILDSEYVSIVDETKADGMCIYAHAYTIKDGLLQPKKLFYYDDKYSYVTKSDTTQFVDWVHDIPSMWPSRFDNESQSLEIAKVYPSSMMSGMLITKTIWEYDEKLGFRTNKETKITELLSDSLGYTLVMTEMLPNHKVKINFDGISENQYMSWPADSAWTSEPALILTDDLSGEKEDSYHFLSEDGYEYVVFINRTPEGMFPGISALEVRKNGIIISREEAEY